MDRVHAVVGEGADIVGIVGIVGIGGGPAALGAEVTIAEEIRRTVPFVAAVRAAYPDLVISVDTWRHQTAPDGTRRHASCARPAPIWSMTPGEAGTSGCPRWPPSTARAWSAATRAACRRGPARTGWNMTT
jgi:Pterin binding enzyme